MAAGRWIVSTEAGGESNPGGAEGGRGLHLYAGTAGVALFLGRLADLTEETWAAEAARAAVGRLSEVADRPEIVPAPGLYSGLGGIAFALAQQDSSADAAQHLIDELLRRTPSGGDWTDVISGTAGYGLTLLWAAERLGRADALAAATVTGDQLLHAAEPAHPDGRGLVWRMQAKDEFVMPNFSHGTAGVAFFLARLAAATGEERFLAAAEAGARHLIAIADPAGAGRLIHHHAPGGEALHYLGWCHGPPGTARLFLQLSQNDPAWAEAVDGLTEGLLATGIPDVRTGGFWNNIGRCCGDAGVAEFAQDLIEMGHGDERVMHLRDACTANVLRSGVEVDTPIGTGLSWPHAEHRNRPEQVEASPGLMQGAAGIGLWLLRAHQISAGVDAPSLRLPDEIEYAALPAPHAHPGKC